MMQYWPDFVDGLRRKPDGGLVSALLATLVLVGSVVRVAHYQGDRWQVVWPINREAKVPPQVIPVNYLRWDVIYRGAEDDWRCDQEGKMRRLCMVQALQQAADHCRARA
jgi:hypothetical protein